MSSAAIHLRDLVVDFGPKRAVDGLSLVVQEGTLLALLGPNGAGKTTTLEVCEGLRRRTAGFVEVLGHDPWRAPADHRARIGVMVQNGGFSSGVRPMEALRAAASLYRHPRDVDALADRLSLKGLTRGYRRLSGGEQQRLGLAVALVGRPDLLVLDEPTAGMDPQIRRRTWDLLREVHADGTTIVVTTHYIEEAEQLAERVAVMSNGSIVADGTPEDLRGGTDYVVRFRSTPGLSLASLLEGAGPTETRVGEERAPGAFTVRSSLGQSVLSAVTEWAAREGHELTDLRAGRQSLEDAVLGLAEWADDD